ncbi:MAG: Holliday junction branch migration protein RuvA [Denitrovibrio sp.]|nr:MAG: Holliday junction branch migration protein RuvA [Denitrovibrio sp.]
MIYSIRGTLIEKSPDKAVIDTGSIALEMNISASTYQQLPETGKDAHVYTHFVMRDDGVYLYGFSKMEEKRLYLLLITISKVGPKLALAILSGMDVNKFMNAVMNSEVGLISTIPGIGKKTAERIVVELKDKFGQISVSETDGAASTGADDVVSALLNMGYTRADCQKAVNKVYKAESSFEELFKQSLKELSSF